MTDPRDDADGDPPGGVATGPESSEADPDPDPESDSDEAVTGPTATAGADGDATVDPERRVAAADVETPGEPRELDPKVRFNWIVSPLFGAVVLTLGAAFVTYMVGYEFLPFDRPTAVAVVGGSVFLFLAVYGVVRTFLLYRSWRYVVRDESLYLTRGVFTTVQTVVPYVRVQHIDTRRSAFERVLGLSTLVVYTAGSRGADVTIPGLLPETAEDLQSRLERLAIASEDEDAV